MVKVQDCGRMDEQGFSLVELLLGITVLGTVLVGFSAFVHGQIGGMARSNQLSSGTQVAVGALERIKSDLADSARFATKFYSAGSGPVVESNSATSNAKTYNVILTYDRAPSPLYALRVTAMVGWNNYHKIRIGVLVPGPNSLLH